MTRPHAFFTFALSLLISTATLAAQSTSASADNQLNSTSDIQTSFGPQLKTEKEQVSYSIGADLGENFKAQGIDVDPAILARGLYDASRGKTLLSQTQMVDTLKKLQQQLISKREAEMKALGDKNKQEGDAYLAENKLKSGVVTTRSGLQYKVLKPGSGAMPSDKAIVKVDYTGKFIDGTIFDKSKAPVTFPITNVIAGWTEVLQLMKPGSIFQVVIPPQLAYGERGIDKVIGPNQTLLFTIHLIEVKPA